jgi:hypothetical protein
MTEWKPTNSLTRPDPDLYDPPAAEGPDTANGKDKKAPAVKSAVPGGKA